MPYIQRDEEEAICGLLRQGRPVLLIGSSMVGKTRMAVQVIRHEFADRPAVIPDSKTALAELNARDIALRGSVIWLDDIDLIGGEGVSDGTSRRLAEADNTLWPPSALKLTINRGHPTRFVARMGRAECVRADRHCPRATGGEQHRRRSGKRPRYSEASPHGGSRRVCGRRRADR